MAATPDPLRPSGPVKTGEISTTGDTERPPPFADIEASFPSDRPRTMPVPPPAPGTPMIAEPTNVGLPALPDLVAAAERAERGAAPVPVSRSAKKCASCGELYPNDFMVCPRDATPLADQAAADQPDPMLGKLLGDTYVIVRVVGEGGMGRVYEARHLRLKERRFAVKCLHVDLAKNQEMAARFLREAESASSIKHPNVIDVFDVHHLPDGTPYLVGEFLEGEELADYVNRKGPLDARMAAKVTRQVCHALAAAHERGIIHRDMKPENIFVLASSILAVERGDGRSLHVKVLDFGISKAGPGDTSHLTRTGVIMGTPSYMSPEQGRGRQVDQRADVYSVGACLYFMVTGRRPFDADDPTSTISMVLTEEPVRPREIDNTIPEGLELIIQRAMAKDANDRYATMLELEAALSSISSHHRSSLAAIPSARELAPSPASESRLQSTGAQRAFDVARAVLGSDSTPPAAQESAALARAARPTIIVASVAAFAWLVGATVAALAGLVRVLHNGEITLTEALLLIIGCIFAAATPIALYVMHVRKVIWPNSVKALQLATDLKRVTVAVLASYGSLAILGRIMHTVLWRSSRGLASGFWDMFLFVVSVIVAGSIGGFAPFLRSQRRRRSE